MHKLILILLLLSVSGHIDGQDTGRRAFKVVPLGVLGGIDESNLSAYMVAPDNTHDYVCFDAGTLHAGIEKAIDHKVLDVNSAYVLKHDIKAYFISHAHLDHVSGLIINSPDDSAKTVYALPSCMQMLEQYYFNGEAWANFGDEGKGFLLNQYHFQTLEIAKSTPVANTNMQVTAFPLSHGKPYESAAFLLNKGNDYVLYLGDTGSDKIEASNKLEELWKTISPLIKARKLKGIFIEVSFPDDQPLDRLFGHLTPGLLMQELEVLCKYAGKERMKDFPIIITHNKPPYERILKIKKELGQQNKVGVKFIFPEQGKAFNL